MRRKVASTWWRDEYEYEHGGRPSGPPFSTLVPLLATHTYGELGEMFGVGAWVIRATCLRAGVRRGRGVRPARIPSADELTRWYWVEGLTLAEIGAAQGVTAQAVSLWFMRRGVSTRRTKRGQHEPDSDDRSGTGSQPGRVEGGDGELAGGPPGRLGGDG
jgi:hypothetical protein